MDKDFISQALRYLGYISAFAVAFAQYFLRDNIASFFILDSRLYSASSLIAFLLSFTIILAIFSNRYTINWSKIYLSRKKHQEYLRQLRIPAQSTPDQSQPFVEEPFGVTVKQIALLLVLITLIAFGGFIYLEQRIYLRSISYIIMILSVIASITIYTTSLYLENDSAQREKGRREAILAKLKEYFAGDIRIQHSWRDETNSFRPFQRMLVQRDGRRYNVMVDANDPEKFFTVDETPSQG